MNRKILSILGVALLVLTFQSCSSNPEKGLLSNYFNAVALKDISTQSSMALQPVSFEFESWDIVNVTEEVVAPFALADLNQKEVELKKQKDDMVGVTIDARTELDNTIYERNNARTASAKRALQRKIDELEKAYEEQRAEYDALQKQYNEAAQAASREEDIAAFSISGDYPNIREFTGDVHSKEVDVQVVEASGTNTYRFYIRQYMLRDEASGMNHRGQWKIVKIEKIG